MLYGTYDTINESLFDESATPLSVLDTEDLHCLRQGRFEAFKKNQKFELTQLNNLDITKREIASIYRCDLALIISIYELDLLINIIKIDKSLLLLLPLVFLIGLCFRYWQLKDERDFFKKYWPK